MEEDNLPIPDNSVDDIPDNIQKLIDEGKVIKTKTSSGAFDEPNQNTLVIDKSTVTSKEYKELKKFADEFEYMLIKPYKVTNQSTGVKTNNFELMKSEYFNPYNAELEKLVPGNGYSLAIYTPHQDQVVNLVSDIFDEYSQYFDKRFELEMYPYKGTEFTDGKSIMLLKQIYIKPEFQGQGIGSEIINKVTNFADELNIPIMLSTDPEQKLVDTLPDYYARFGFLDTGEVVKRTGNKERWLIRQPGELAGKIVEYGEVADDFETYEEALQAARNTDKPLYPDYIIKQITDRGQTVPGLDTPTNVADDISQLADTPTNVVGDADVYYHSRLGEIDNAQDIHFGTYDAALDRASLQYGKESVQSFYARALDEAYDLFREEVEALELVDDGSGNFKLPFKSEQFNFELENKAIPPKSQEWTFEYITEGETIRLNYIADDGFETLIDEFYVETIDYEGADVKKLGDLDVEDIIGSKKGFRELEGHIQALQEGQPVDVYKGKFDFGSKYNLYKTTIKPDAKVFDMSGQDIEITELVRKRGESELSPKTNTVSSEFLQYRLFGEDAPELRNISEIKIDNVSYKPKGNVFSSNDEIIEIISNNADVVAYTNEIEDAGSTSIYVRNADAVEVSLAGEQEITDFNKDVRKKYVETSVVDEQMNLIKAADRGDISTEELDELIEIRKPSPKTGPPELETRIKVSTQNPEDFGVPGNVEDYKEIEGWADDVIKPNKIFNPDALTRLESSTIGQRYIWNDTTEFKPSEMYSRIITNNATDEDITRFFIYLATHSEQPAYAMKSFKQPDALADIVKIGIFSDRPITDIIPIGVHLQETIFIGNLRNSNSQIGDEINKVLVDLVLERGQFTNLRETMRNVILEAHNDIYRQNPNDYFVLWRGGDLHRFHPWQSFTKHPSAAQDIANQMDMMYGAGTEVKSYIINKNNMIDLDALGLSFNDENEIIVLTEAANKPNATVVNIQTPEDLQNAYRTFQKNVANNDFPKQGFDIQNISKPLADAGQESQEFFSDVIKGMDDRYRPRKAYNPIIELNHPDLQSTIDIYNKNVLNGGDFNQHIFTSIPTFYETQIVKAKALENMLRNVIDPTAPDIRILDIGATEGVWAKTLTTEYPQVFVNIIEPNPAAKEIFEKEFSDRVMFTQEAFSHYEKDRTRFFSETGKPIKYFTPSENFKYDVVHESMTFQFIDSDRKGQVEYIKNNILKEDGILFIEEKFFSDDAIYKANEELKDKFKLQYYTPEQLETKAIEVLHGMGTKQIPVKDMENILNNNFKYVEQYWDAGNFKGYIASDNELATQFVPEIKKLRTSLTNHIYSTAPTEQEIKASIQKQVKDRGVNKELNKQLTKELTETNKEFIGKASDAVQTIFKNVKSVGGVGLALGLKGLSKAAPVLEPGDVLIEKAIEKFSPQLNKAAQKLGFASLPVDKILPVYVALEIGIAAAEAVQAAMYAYDETAKKKKGGYIYEYKNIDGKTRYVPVRDEDGEPIFQPAFNTYDFYNTPAGQEVAKEFDFGSNFLRQLEQERVSRYSPGWNLSKAIFGLFGTMGDAQANISEQTRGNMGQALLTGIGK